MKLPRSLTTVTFFSKSIALILFITLPFIGFLLGMKYQKSITPNPSPIIKATTTNGKFCGGFGAIECSEGYRCELSGSYPDAGGVCREE